MILLRLASLSKEAISRLIGRLDGDFEKWSQPDLAGQRIRYLFLDGWCPRVRIGKKRVRVPVLMTLGTTADGERVLLDLRIAGERRDAMWTGRLASLVTRNVGRPVLAVIDGSPGLARALRHVRSAIDVQWCSNQRCTNHKLWKLLAKPEEVAEDYVRMISAEAVEAVQQARTTFTRKWKLRCKAVLASFDEAGDDLLTFLRCPRSQLKALRTTNALEKSYRTHTHGRPDHCRGTPQRAPTMRSGSWRRR